MFAVHSPQTITLAHPGEDEPALTINLKTNDADTSRCVMEISNGDGAMFRLVFNTRGNLVDQQYIEPSDDNDASLTNEPNASAHIVDGRDIRAFDPYTHKPPVDADTAYRDPNPGFRSPQPVDDETRQAAANARQASAEAAQKARQELIDRANEAPEARQERERSEEAERRAKEDERLQKLAEREAKSGGVAQAKTFPSQETQDLVYGKDMAGNPNPPKADGQGNIDPMAPAPSSPQPGSPPPHPLSQPDPGKVTTSKDMAGEPAGTSAEQERVEAQETAYKRAEVDRAKVREDEKA